MSVESRSGSTLNRTNNTDTASLLLQFVDLLLEPIEGLHYEIRYVNGGVIDANISGGMGTTPCYNNLQAESDIIISVKRDADGTFKEIGRSTLDPGYQEITMQSPKIRLEAETQQAAGSPGTAHEVQPPTPPDINAVTANNRVPAPAKSAPATYTVKSGDYPGKIAAKFGMTTQQFLALNPQIKDVTKMQIGDIVIISGKPAPAAPTSTPPKPMSSSGTKSKPSITMGRDAAGLPVALYVNNAKDWLGRTVAIPYNWLISQNAQTGAAPAQGHPSVNPPSNEPAVKKTETPSSKAMEHLQALMAFAEEQVKYKYGEGTRAVLKKHFSSPGSYNIGTSTFPSGANDWPGKETYKSIGKCQVYVNVALAMAGYWNGQNTTSVARESGKDWLAAGFKNVTSELPTVDINMSKGGVVKQVDILYTCPGDVIVYEKYGEPDQAGHVDIRTYHGFISDFVWGPARAGLPNQSIYKVIGVYRKYSDTVAIARLKAFLRIIRERETTDHPDPYHALHSNKAGVFLTFKDESEHPGGTAGAYQMQRRTFDGIHINSVTYWPKDFMPDTQDRLAVFLMLVRPYSSWKHPRRNGLGYVLQGKLESALNETTLNKEWVSLPGGSQSRGFTFEEMKHIFERYTAEYCKKALVR